MVRTALVLRPEPGLSATLKGIERIEGWRGIGLSLTRRKPTGAPRPPGSFDAVAFTSAEATRVLEHNEDLRAVPIHTIGSETARWARTHGGARVRVGLDGTAPPDGTEFGRLLGPRYKGHTILYPCAEERRPGFEREATGGGASVVPWPVYRTEVDPRSPARLREVFRNTPPDAVLLHAPSAAKGLRESANIPETTAILCLSKAIADALPAACAARIRIAERPTDEALLSLLVDAPSLDGLGRVAD